MRKRQRVDYGHVLADQRAICVSGGIFPDDALMPGHLISIQAELPPKNGAPLFMLRPCFGQKNIGSDLDDRIRSGHWKDGRAKEVHA